jgi:hypothetical protein
MGVYGWYFFEGSFLDEREMSRRSRTKGQRLSGVGTNRQIDAINTTELARLKLTYSIGMILLGMEG